MAFQILVFRILFVLPNNKCRSSVVFQLTAIGRGRRRPHPNSDIINTWQRHWSTVHVLVGHGRLAGWIGQPAGSDILCVNLSVNLRSLTGGEGQGWTVYLLALGDNREGT